MHRHRHQDIGDDQQIQHEAGERRDQRDDDAQHGERHGHFAEHVQGQIAEPVGAERPAAARVLAVASWDQPGSLPFISLKM